MPRSVRAASATDVPYTGSNDQICALCARAEQQQQQQLQQIQSGSDDDEAAAAAAGANHWVKLKQPAQMRHEGTADMG